MEWVGGGSLFDFLASYNQPFSEEIAQYVSWKNSSPSTFSIIYYFKVLSPD
jgi:hypothetical protein